MRSKSVYSCQEPLDSSAKRRSGTPGGRHENLGLERNAAALDTLAKMGIEAPQGNRKSVHFDWMACFVAIDNPTSTALTRESLEWQPKELELL